MSSTTATSAPVRRGSPDPVERSATAVVGGPRGRYAADVPPRVGHLLAAGLWGLGACLTLVLGFLQKSYCVRHGWGIPQVYWKACYSDLPNFAVQPGLSGGGLPYDAGSAIAEPVVTGAVLRLLAVFVPDSGLERQQGMVVAWTITSALLLVATVAATVWTCRHRPSRAAHVALSPLLVTVALLSTDLLGVTLGSIALWLWSSRRPTAAGVLFGLAIAARTYPVLLLVALGILALRSGVLREWARTAGVTLVTTVVLVGAVFVPYGTGALAAYDTWLRAPASFGSPWFLASLWDRPIAVGLLTVLVMMGWGLALGAGALLGLGSNVRPRVGEVAVVIVVIVLISGKALPPQSSLWLVPLIALAGLPWRDHLVWATTEVLYFVAVWLYLGGVENVSAALPKSWYALFLVLRLAGLCWLAVAAARQALHRGVHRGQVSGAMTGWVDTEEIDDAAGVMTGRRDAVVVRYER